MKLQYMREKPIKILFPEYHEVKKGYVIETEDKLFAKELKMLGFVEVENEKTKKKAGDK
jgi:hypothetical protein